MPWMFQANPRKFDIDGALRTGRQLRWALRQHARDVAVGDPALIWRSGPSRGIVAVGVVAGVRPDEPEVAEWEEEFELEPFDPASSAVIAELNVAVVPLIPDVILRQDPVLSNLLVLRRPNATVFRVSDEEWEALGPLT